MLNELHDLSGALSQMKIETRVWHREYKPLPNVTTKFPCYKVLVSEAGIITGIDEIPQDTARVLRKFGNNQASFPAFNIKPLYRITDANHKKMIEEMIKNPSPIELDRINEWLINDNWHRNLKNIDASIQNICERLLSAIELNKNKDSSVIIKLIQSTNALIGGLRSVLESYILKELEKGNYPQLY